MIYIVINSLVCIVYTTFGDGFVFKGAIGNIGQIRNAYQIPTTVGQYHQTTQSDSHNGIQHNQTGNTGISGRIDRPYDLASQQILYFRHAVDLVPTLNCIYWYAFLESLSDNNSVPPSQQHSNSMLNNTSILSDWHGSALS